jgi:hypothetical protein
MRGAFHFLSENRIFSSKGVSDPTYRLAPKRTCDLLFTLPCAKLGCVLAGDSTYPAIKALKACRVLCFLRKMQIARDEQKHWIARR